MDDAAASLSPENRAALMARLEPGETLIWASEPSRGARLAGCFTALVAIPFIGFGLFWEALTLLPLLTGSATGNAFEWFGALFGLPFLAVGVLALWSPRIMARRAARTVYAFTDRRMIRMLHGEEEALSEVPTDRIADVSFHEYSDGSGTLTVNTNASTDPEGEVAATYQIAGVKDVKRIHQRMTAHLRSRG